MLFSTQDIDLLRLLRWCRFLSCGDILPLFPADVIENLLSLKLLRQHCPEQLLYLLTRGNALLDETFTALPPATPPSYKASETLRRSRVSKILLTAYRARLSVFTSSLQALASTGTCFLPTVMRGRGSNPWGSTRIAALLNLGDILYAVHYVCPGIGRLALTDELTAFINNTASFRSYERRLIFAGASCDEILTELSEPLDGRDTKLVTYADAYRQLHLPVHLLPCGDLGARQLQLMNVSGYRERLSKLALRSQYTPPPKEIPCWDACYERHPVCIAADLELRRIDAAVDTAKTENCSPVYLVALDEQLDSILLPRYRSDRQVRFFALKEAALAELLGQPTGLYAPPPTQFLTEKGAVIRAPLIKTH